jgi:hypothetical protein
MTVLVRVHDDREAATAASPRSGAETLPEAYARLTAWAGGCAIETGHIGALVDNECEHERLPTDSTPPCGCWASEVVKDPPLVRDAGGPPEMAEAKPETPVSTEATSGSDELQVVEVIEAIAEVEATKPPTPVPTESASQLDEIPPFVEALIEQIDAELDRLRAERAAVLTLKEAIA